MSRNGVAKVIVLVVATIVVVAVAAVVVVILVEVAVVYSFLQQSVDIDIVSSYSSSSEMIWIFW